MEYGFGMGKVPRPRRNMGGVFISVLGRWARRWINHRVFAKFSNDARPRSTVTLPADAGTNLHWLVTEAHVCEQLAQDCTGKRCSGRGSRTRDLLSQVQRQTTTPPNQPGQGWGGVEYVAGFRLSSGILCDAVQAYSVHVASLPYQG